MIEAGSGGWEPKVTLTDKQLAQLRQLLPDLADDRLARLVDSTEDALASHHHEIETGPSQAEIADALDRIEKLTKKIEDAIEPVRSIVRAELMRAGTSLHAVQLSLLRLRLAALRSPPPKKGRGHTRVALLGDALAGIWEEIVGEVPDRLSTAGGFYKFVKIIAPAAGIVLSDYRAMIRPRARL